MKMLSGLTKKTTEHIALDAGVLFTGLDMESYGTAQALLEAITPAIKSGSAGGITCLGATRGGGTYSVEMTWRQIEADGARGDTKGMTVLDEGRVHLSATLLEITPGNLVLAMATGEQTQEGSITKITIRKWAELTDYKEHLVWVGNRADGQLIALDLYNAINTAGTTITYTDKGEAVMPVDMYAHAEDVEDTDMLPTAIYIIGPAITRSALPGAGQ